MPQFAIPRLPWDSYFMLQAHLVATRATCDRGPSLFFDPARHGVGCVIVRDRRIIASGYNGAPGGLAQCDEPEHGHLMVEGHCTRVLHSEINALLQCALDESSPKGSTLYCTASPCFDCTKAIIRAEIVRVVVGAHYESRYGLSSASYDLLASARVAVDALALRPEDFLKQASPTDDVKVRILRVLTHRHSQTRAELARATGFPDDTVFAGLMQLSIENKVKLLTGRWWLNDV